LDEPRAKASIEYLRSKWAMAEQKELDIKGAEDRTIALRQELRLLLPRDIPRSDEVATLKINLEALGRTIYELLKKL
jgi:hypothetical protein